MLRTMIHETVCMILIFHKPFTLISKSNEKKITKMLCIIKWPYVIENTFIASSSSSTESNTQKERERERELWEHNWFDVINTTITTLFHDFLVHKRRMCVCACVKYISSDRHTCERM